MQPDLSCSGSAQLIRRLRKARGLTLAQLSERTKVSVSYLSQIENGHTNLRLGLLRKIALALGVPMIDLIVDEQERKLSLVRVEDRRTYALDSGAIESLLYTRERPHLEATIMDLAPGVSSGPWNSHPGQEFTYVLHGRMRIWIEERSIDLSEGDIVYYQSSLQHRWENPFNVHVQFLIANTPATF